VRQAASDLYYNFASFIPANLIFGVGLIVVIGAAASSPLGWLVIVGLVPLTAGCMRLATTLVRDGHTDLGDFAGMVRRPWQVLAVGGAQLGIALVLVVDLLIGASLESPVGGVLVVSALYGLGILWIYAVVAWPIVLDPLRSDQPLGDRLRLAAMVLVGNPLRMAGLAMIIGLFLMAATVLVAAIVTFALALACLVAARFVLPAADRLEEPELVGMEDGA
jgi:hypothetical protein